jgi:hypothetical protein
MVVMRWLFSLVLLLAAASAVAASYSVVVAENGNAFVAISLTGQGTVSVLLPVDASPRVTGALYVPTSSGIDVAVGSNGAANVIFQSSTLTDKSGDTWTVSVGLSSASQNSVTISLPPNSNVKTTIPPAEVADVKDSRNVVWNNAAGTVSASYSVLPSTAPQAAPQADWTLVIIAAVIVIIVIAAFLFLKKKK